MKNRSIVIENFIGNRFTYNGRLKIFIRKDFREAQKIISELLLVFFGSPYAKHRSILRKVLPAYRLNEPILAGNTYS